MSKESKLKFGFRSMDLRLIIITSKSYYHMNVSKSHITVPKAFFFYFLLMKILAR